MDVTPEAVREGKFREALRGYNRDDVDEFLERVASGIAVLQEWLRQATDRAARAEAQATEAAELDESLRRTLVLAQRTADLAMEEARREAAQLVEDATARRESLLSETDQERDRLRAETQQTIQDEVHLLHETRERLTADIAELGHYHDRQREWLRAALTEQLRVLDQGGFDIGPPPAVSEVDPAIVNGSVPPVVPDEVIDAVRPEGDVDEGPSTVAMDVIDLDDDGPDRDSHDAVEDKAEDSEAGEADVSARLANGNEGHASSESNGIGAGTAAAFLSELQRVMDNGSDPSEDDVLPPPDERARAFFDSDDEAAERRFGGLRRRRRRP